MKNTRPQQVTGHHLQRRAVVYIRCAVYSAASVDQQVTQKDFALKWGWPIDAIEVIGDDVASNGLDVSRIGYQRLRRRIEAGQVGLVLVSDPTRLSRSSAEWERFLVLCQSTNTLLAVNGAIHPRDVNEQLLDQFRQCMAAFEKHQRARWRRSRQRPAANEAPKRHRP